MNHPRKKAAVKKHFSEPYENLEQLRAGLKADEAGYTDTEIEEIMEAIGEEVKTKSEAAAPKSDVPPMSPEELAEFNAWKASKNALNAASTGDLVKVVTAAVPKVNRYKDYDVFQGNTIKETVTNPFNPERPNVVIRHIQLGERKRMSRIEPALAHELNEYGTGQETGMNHGQVSTAEFYFPAGKYTQGSKISFQDFAAFQRQDIRYADKYHPSKNISLLVASGYGQAIV